MEAHSTRCSEIKYNYECTELKTDKEKGKVAYSVTKFDKKKCYMYVWMISKMNKCPQRLFISM